MKDLSQKSRVEKEAAASHSAGQIIALALKRRPLLYFLVSIIISVFVAEAAVMLLLFFVLPSFSELVATLIDSLLLLVLLSPSLYFFLFRPLMQEVRERRKAEEKLREYGEHLEESVEQRTAELNKANEQLLQEVAARQEAEELFRSIVAIPPVAFSIHQDGKFRFVNPTVHQYTGYREDELLGTEALRFILSEDRGIVREIALKMLKGERVSPYEYRAVNKAGEVRWRMETVSSLQYQGRRAVLAASMDITERKQAEELLQAIIANSAASIYIIQEGKFQLVNPQLQKYTGYSEAELLGMYSANLVLPEDRKIAKENAVKMLQGELSSPYEFRYVAKGGKTGWGLERVTLIQYRGGPAVLGTSMDITERKQAEKALVQKTVELTRSNADLQQFAYIASHDLQEPLRMISSFVQLLARRYKGKLNADADEFIAYAVEGANRLRNMINGLLEYSRVETRGKPPEPVNSGVVLEQALANLKIAIEESAAVITYGALPTVAADATQLVQLFQNLIANALKFRREESLRIHISAEQKEKEWVFSVRDNSVGIEPQYKERLFTVFQRLHGREYPGVGIGLALCRRIVERHGGRIWVESEPGKGSTFYFSIPFKAEGTTVGA